MCFGEPQAEPLSGELGAHATTCRSQLKTGTTFCRRLVSGETGRPVSRRGGSAWEGLRALSSPLCFLKAGGQEPGQRPPPGPRHSHGPSSRGSAAHRGPRFPKDSVSPRNKGRAGRGACSRPGALLSPAPLNRVSCPPLRGRPGRKPPLPALLAGAGRPPAPLVPPPLP